MIFFFYTTCINLTSPIRTYVTLLFADLPQAEQTRRWFYVHHLLDILFAFVHFLVEFLLLVRRDRSLSLAVGLSGRGQLLLLAGHVVRFLSRLHLHMQIHTGVISVSDPDSPRATHEAGQFKSKILYVCGMM